MALSEIPGSPAEAAYDLRGLVSRMSDAIALMGRELRARIAIEAAQNERKEKSDNVNPDR